MMKMRHLLFCGLRLGSCARLLGSFFCLPLLLGSFLSLLLLGLLCGLSHYVCDLLLCVLCSAALCTENKPGQRAAMKQSDPCWDGPRLGVCGIMIACQLADLARCACSCLAATLVPSLLMGTLRPVRIMLDPICFVKECDCSQFDWPPP